MGTSVDPLPWKSINGTKEITSTVTLDGAHRSIITSIIKGLQSGCDENGVAQGLKDIGSKDQIKIKRGPFADFICTMDYIHDDRRT